MPIRLFHRTTRDAAKRIFAEGFRSGPQGGVWLSKNPDAVGEDGRWLLVVMLDISEEVLEMYGVDVATDETWDDETWDELTGRWVKLPVEQVRSVRWYEIPPEAVNAKGSVHAISREDTPLFEYGQVS